MKLKNHLTILLIISIFSFFSGFIIYGFYPKKAVSKENKTVLSKPEIRGLMSFEPSRISVGKSKEFKVRIIIDAKGKIINAVDVVLSFDPLILKPVKIDTQNLSKNLSFPRKQIQDNKIYITAIKTKKDNAPTNQIILAVITFKALKQGTTVLNFDHFPGKTFGSTIIRAKDSVNILDRVNDARIEIR